MFKKLGVDEEAEHRDHPGRWWLHKDMENDETPSKGGRNAEHLEVLCGSRFVCRGNFGESLAASP